MTFLASHILALTNSWFGYSFWSLVQRVLEAQRRGNLYTVGNQAEQHSKEVRGRQEVKQDVPQYRILLGIPVQIEFQSV